MDKKVWVSGGNDVVVFKQEFSEILGGEGKPFTKKEYSVEEEQIFHWKDITKKMIFGIIVSQDIKYLYALDLGGSI
jgi:hypothetical protein